MKNLDMKKSIDKISSVSQYIPSIDLINVFSNLATTFQEDRKSKSEIAKIEARKEILIHEMENRFELYHKVFGLIFDERGKAIDKSFDIIDKGLKDNDKDLISMGLKSLSTVVSSSPFGNLADLSKMLESNNVIEI